MRRDLTGAASVLEDRPGTGPGGSEFVFLQREEDDSEMRDAL